MAKTPEKKETRQLQQPSPRQQQHSHSYPTYSRPGSNLGAIFQRVQQSDRVKEQNAWQAKADAFVAQRRAENDRLHPPIIPAQETQTSGTPVQRQEDQAPVAKPNNTGLPDQLKTGIENLSGYSMDDVKVHYNSDKPAQLQAHAYAQGTDIHLASGQEKHLPHEAWHVVQQKQGRVKPTMQMRKANANNHSNLESSSFVIQRVVDDDTINAFRDLYSGLSYSQLRAEENLRIELLEANPNEVDQARLNIIRENLTEIQGKTGNFIKITEFTGDVNVQAFGPISLIRDTTSYKKALDFSMLIQAGIKKLIRHNESRTRIGVEVIFQNVKNTTMAYTNMSNETIMVHMQEYQLREYSLGELLGLATHELGVHTLANTLMSNDEIDAENAEERSFKGKDYEIKEEPGTTQQLDHLSVAIGFLGAARGKPRNEIYKSLMLSIASQTSRIDDKEREDIVISYLVDLARIIVLNDDKSKVGLFNMKKVNNQIKEKSLDILGSLISESYDDAEREFLTNITKEKIGKALKRLIKIVLPMAIKEKVSSIFSFS